MYGCGTKQNNKLGAKIMDNTPVIVISSSVAGVGKTTLTLNLAAALWSDGYEVKLFAPNNPMVENFIRQRKNLRSQSGEDLPLPQLINDLNQESQHTDKTVILADIPTSKNSVYKDVFARAHTLISVATDVQNLQWKLTDPYMNLIWETKKSVAARGIKYLNWIAVLNMAPEQQNAPIPELRDAAKKLGFRIAEPLHRRDAFRYIENGYCAADMAKFRRLFKMSMSDVYARREILTLTDFLWNA